MKTVFPMYKKTNKFYKWNQKFGLEKIILYLLYTQPRATK